MAISDKHNNNSFVGSSLLLASRREEMDAFDILPDVIRHRLDQTASKLSAISVVKKAIWCDRQGWSKERSVRYILEQIDMIEANEILVFDGRYRAETGNGLPCLAAEASVMRYSA